MFGIGQVEGIIIAGVGLFVYFIPTVLAGNRGHGSVAGVFALNLLAGWTLVGWIIAIVWALAGDTARTPAVIGPVRRCTFCKGTIPVDASKCQHCGEWTVESKIEALQPGMRVCTACGRPMNMQAAYCKVCGTPVAHGIPAKGA